ncbi:hypothetical protein ES703_62084 [subsurface metagenome]
MECSGCVGKESGGWVAGASPKKPEPYSFEVLRDIIRLFHYCDM